TLAALDELRASGRRVGLTAFLVRATALAVKAHPALNRRVFRRWTGPREVTWGEVSCNLVVARDTPDGEILLPVVIRHADTLSVHAIEARIREAKTAPLDALPEMAARKQLARAPRVALRVFDRL